MEQEEANRIHAAILLCIAEAKLRDLGLETLSDEMATKVNAVLTTQYPPNQPK